MIWPINGNSLIPQTLEALTAEKLFKYFWFTAHGGAILSINTDVRPAGQWKRLQVFIQVSI
jgi:uncharacterized protein YndB with AHSA1/START domain